MALLRLILTAVVLLAPDLAHGHRMGKVIPLLCEEGPVPVLACHVVAAYVGEQMGADIEPRQVTGDGSFEKYLEARESPWALKCVASGTVPSWGPVEVGPRFTVDGQEAIILMTRESRKDLKFSLLPLYLERIRDGLEEADWKAGLARVRAGEGVRKVALDMLRGKDLL